MHVDVNLDVVLASVVLGRVLDQDGLPIALEEGGKEGGREGRREGGCECGLCRGSTWPCA